MMEDFWDPYGEPPEPPDHFDFMEDCEIEDDGLPPWRTCRRRVVMACRSKARP